jgi:hypothetical protein
VPPGSRRAVGHRIEECLPFSGIFDLLQLLRQVEIIPADAVLDEPLAGFLHSWSSFSACRNSRELPTETARVKRSESLSESAERVLSGRIHQIRIQGDCPAGKPRGRDAGGVQDSEAAHLNSLKRALESQISMSYLVPLLEFNQVALGLDCLAVAGKEMHVLSIERKPD